MTPITAYLNWERKVEEGEDFKSLRYIRVRYLMTNDDIS